MCKHPGSSELIKVIEHLPELRPIIPSIVLLSAIQNGNYILVERILAKQYKLLTDQQIDQAQYLVNDSSNLYSKKFGELL
mmetsp:Transcript_8494/g.7851  ORF Transcript_8494/g.7851 Transcript_8494/m.7851 type:complete len:80 (-) Transcript_8494:1090-1329(-)